MHLLDTNVCIDFAKGRSEPLRFRMRDALKTGLGMSAVTLAELSVGARASADPAGDARRLAAMTALVPVYAFDREAAASYGRLARAIGVRRHSFDGLIAAHAVALGAILVTNNQADFADIPGLSVENWTLPLA